MNGCFHPLTDHFLADGPSIISSLVHCGPTVHFHHDKKRSSLDGAIIRIFVNDYPTFKTLLFITLFRFISVYGLTFILNKVRLEPIGKVDQFVMAYGGLRGGIAFSLTKLTSIQLVPQVKGCLMSVIPRVVS